MSWQQVKQFNINQMGRKADWCLQNCRLGFGIKTGHFGSAKEDLDSQQKNKTIHNINTLPKNCAVPVYVDTSSPYEHVVVVDHGIWYSDGVKIKPISNVYGWGEYCDGVRVVKWVEDKKKSVTAIAKEVIEGVWGNGLTRKKRLTDAGYNYDEVQQKVNDLLNQKPGKKSDTTIAKEVIQGKWGNGRDRMIRLRNAGYNYETIQSIVNRLMK